MYIVKDDRQFKPFAIIKNPWYYKVRQALLEEFSFTDVQVEPIEFPDYGETTAVNYFGTTEDGDEVRGMIEITKLVDY